MVDVSRGADPAAGRAAKRKEATLADLVDRYVSEHLKVHNRASTAKEFERIGRVEIVPALGTIRVSGLTRPEIRAWHAGYSKRPYLGNRALAVLRKILSLAARDWELRNDNPALGIKLFRELPRERFATDDELRIIGSWLRKVEGEGSQSAGAFLATRLLALTGMRLGEVLGLQ